MRGKIALYSENGIVVRCKNFDSPLHRKEILLEWKMMYGNKFDLMSILISPELSDELHTNKDGSNFKFGGRIGHKDSGIKYKTKKAIRSPK